MPLKRMHVLVVDDDPADFAIVEALLGQASRSAFTLSHIDSFESALECLQERRYDVFLVDYFLGSETALPLLEEALHQKISQPIIVLTGADGDTLDDVVIENGAADFLPKSELTSELLERTIRHAVEHKKVQLKLERLAKQDALTGLGNRLLFEELLEKSLARAKRKEGKLAVLFLDLDRFKEINDTLGHPTGDLLLLMVADRLRTLVRDSDVVARIGGDEFTILLDELQDYQDAVIVAEKIIESLSQPSAIRGNELIISASVGIAVYPDNGDSPIELMQKADIALYEAKRRGASRTQFFTARLQTELERNLDVERGLRQGLDRDEFQIQLQPKWELASRRIIGFEALLRWRREEGEPCMPDRFIPIAEKTGLILPLGDWVIDEACRVLAHWQERGLDGYSIAVNVSPVQLHHRGFKEQLAQSIKRHGVNPRSLELELTEETLIDITQEEGRVLTDLQAIKELGVMVSIDDFGTGYSSLRYLKHFPADNLKIDRSFVSGEKAGLSEPAIARAIVTLSESLGLAVVAEGIETEEQLEQLRQFGCKQGQGYFIAAPMSVEEALQFALRHNTALEETGE
ncbi:MAG: EAL domain-containing protein [Marinobacter sp.]|nr:EAL domain-containing protein [Marinobacter sp.]